MSDLVKRLRSAGADGDAIHCWNMASLGADRIEALEAALRQAREALLYHTEQTRPIVNSQVAMHAINDLLKD